ncbi:MAG: tripartite tricarboxylate transporter substrate binding protein, partial [bacterium]
MRLILFPLRRAALALLLSTCALGSQAADPWPSKPVRILVGFPAGTSPDLVARTLSEPLGKALGQSVVVENRPGAGGNIA